MNYFYCTECKFEYLDTESRGFFGEPVARIIPKEPYTGAQIDYLLHCPMCNASTCGVIKVDHNDLDLKSSVKSKLRAIIEYSVDKPAINNIMVDDKNVH